MSLLFIMYSLEIHFWRLSGLIQCSSLKDLMCGNKNDNWSVSVWKYSICSSDLMVLHKREMWLLVTFYKLLQYLWLWEQDSATLIRRNHGHVRLWKNDPKFKNIWENLSSQKNSQVTFLSVFVYQLKIKYTVPVSSVRCYWSVSYCQNRWVCVYHSLTFHHVLMLDSRAAFYLEWYLLRLH